MSDNGKIGLISDGEAPISSEAVAGKVYRDELIVRSGERPSFFTPLRYRQMRSIASSAWAAESYSSARLFYAQGKFMEDFTDDFEYNGEFVRYYPTYEDMTVQQLRGYFTWRTRLRSGDIRPTSLSFAFVYIYELLNQIGVQSAEDGYKKLQDFCRRYGELDSGIKRYMRIWMSDYAVYYGLDRSLFDNTPESEFEQRVLTLLDYKSRTRDEIFEAVNGLSSYNMTNSKLYRAYPEETGQAAAAAFAALAGYYEKNRKHDICERFFGKVYSCPYNMFRSAVFFRREKHPDTVYEVNGINRYICTDGKWTSERLYASKGRNGMVGDFLRSVDCIMRKRRGLKPELKADNMTKLYREIINGALDELERQKRAAARKNISIDISALAGIRASAEQTMERLLEGTEERQYDGAEAEAAEKQGCNGAEAETAKKQRCNGAEAERTYGFPDAEPAEALNRESGKERQTACSAAAPGETAKCTQQAQSVLNTEETEFLLCLLQGRSYCRGGTGGTMISVLMDSVNEKLYDVFSDTVLAGDENSPEIIEDYRSGLMEILKI